MQRTTAVNEFLKHKPRFTSVILYPEQIEQELLIH